jgi:hypothetical protein
MAGDCHADTAKGEEESAGERKGRAHLGGAVRRRGTARRCARGLRRGGGAVAAALGADAWLGEKRVREEGGWARLRPEEER